MHVHACVPRQETSLCRARGGGACMSCMYMHVYLAKKPRSAVLVVEVHVCHACTCMCTSPRNLALPCSWWRCMYVMHVHACVPRQETSLCRARGGGACMSCMYMHVYLAKKPHSAVLVVEVHVCHACTCM